MLNSSEQAKEKIWDTIDKLVQDFNAQNSEHPIIVFQFVSVDAITNRNLIWWSYDHEEVSEKYNKIVQNFIGKKKVERTLVNWEYDGGAYRYAAFGNGKIIPKFTNERFKPGKIPDRIDLNKIFKNKEANNQILERWEGLLRDGFSNGSTMWVSLPHTDNLGREIYSSVFTLFNSKLPENKEEPDQKKLLEAYRLFRNFIIQYLIDHYRRPLIESKIALTKKLTALEKPPDLTQNNFKPNGYSVSGKKSNEHIKELEQKYFETENHLADFEEIKTAALKRVKKTYDKKSKNSFNQVESDYQFVYSPIANIEKGDKAKFKSLLYGRFMILTYHLVFELSLEKSWYYLMNAHTPLFTFTELQKRFAIDGLRNDREDVTGNYSADINLDKVVPHISEAEYELLVAISEEFKSFRWDEIQEARKVSL